MELNDAALRQLADLEQDERSILSLFLDLTDGWEGAESRLAESADRVRSALDGSEEDALDVALELADEEISRRKAENEEAHGLAVFVSPDEGVQHSIRLPTAPRPLLTFDEEATIYPLALQLDEYEPVGVIVADASGARILVVAGSVRRELDSVRASIRHLSKVGGWSQMRYQRRRGEQVKRAAGEIVDAARQAFDDEGVGRILLAGRGRMITALREAMPQSMAEKVIGTLAWDLDAGDDELLAEARPVLEAAERAEERELLEKFRSELRRGGLAAAGPEEVRKALEWGAVDVLLMAPDCCGDDTEELATLATTTSAEVEIVPEPGRVLAANGGVGALLRFPVY